MTMKGSPWSPESDVTGSFWAQALNCLQSGETIFLAHVVANGRHSPGTRGACLGLRKSGETWGTIGGGIMEARLIEEGLIALEQGDAQPRLETLHHRRKARGKLSGLMCAGHQTNLYHILNPDDADLIARIVQVIDEDRPGLLTYTAGGLSLAEGEAGDPAHPPIIVEGENESAGWRVTEQLLNWKRVAIIGGGHCGLALSRVMQQLGYTVSIFDTRPDVFTFATNTYARHRIVVEDYAEAGPRIHAPRWTHVVVMTSDFPSDVRGLLGTVGKPFPYLGVMGAPAKLERIRADLRDAGVAPEAIAAIRAPIGLPMTSNTPEEIAISVAAQILQEREALFPWQ